MRRFVCFLLCFLACFTVALAGEELTSAELTAWTAACLQHAVSGETLREMTDEDGHAFIGETATFYTEDTQLTAASRLTGLAVTTGETICPHDTMLDIFPQTLISAFRSDNETLDGSRDCAVLYLDETRPGLIGWAWVLRDGQRILAIQYAIHEQLDGGWTDMGLVYTIENDLVTAVRAYGLNRVITDDELEAQLNEVREAAGNTGYHAYPTSLDGSTLAKLGEDDLYLEGLPFLGGTAEDAAEVFGVPISDEWIEDGSAWLRVMTFNGCSLTFSCSENKEDALLASFYCDTDCVEGPRGVRVGDTLASVLKRFRYGEGEYDEQTGVEMLYGDGVSGPWGMAEFGEHYSAVRYAVPVDGRTVILRVELENNIVSCVMLYAE